LVGSRRRHVTYGQRGKRRSDCEIWVDPEDEPALAADGAGTFASVILLILIAFAIYFAPAVTAVNWPVLPPLTRCRRWKGGAGHW